MCKEKYLKGTMAMSNPYDVDSKEDDPKVANHRVDMGQGSCILSMGEGDRKCL